MFSLRTLSILAAALVLLPAAAQAHPGHALTDNIGHLLTSPYHLAALAAAGAVAGVAAHLARRPWASYTAAATATLALVFLAAA